MERRFSRFFLLMDELPEVGDSLPAFSVTSLVGVPFGSPVCWLERRVGLGVSLTGLSSSSRGRADIEAGNRGKLTSPLA